MGEPGSRSTGQVRAAELIGTLSLATDLAIGVPLEHGLQSTLIAMRLAELLGVDQETASQTYYACLLFYVGCTATSELGADIFGSEDALTRYATPFRFGSRRQMISGMIRAVAPPVIGESSSKTWRLVIEPVLASGDENRGQPSHAGPSIPGSRPVQTVRALIELSEKPKSWFPRSPSSGWAAAVCDRSSC